MVRFHLVGLIAVGLVIQFPSALAILNSECALYADNHAENYHDCKPLRRSDPGAHLLYCVCSDDKWYHNYNICLEKVLKDPGLIPGEDLDRCHMCRYYYGSQKLVPGQVFPSGFKSVHGRDIVPGMVGCKPKGI